MGDCQEALNLLCPVEAMTVYTPLLPVNSLHPGISSKDYPLDQNKHHKNIYVMGGKKRSKTINTSTALKTSCAVHLLSPIPEVSPQDHGDLGSLAKITTHLQPVSEVNPTKFQRNNSNQGTNTFACFFFSSRFPGFHWTTQTCKELPNNDKGF